MRATLRFDRRRVVLFPAAALVLSSLALGCAPNYNLKATEPTRSAVLDAVSEVIHNRYPMSRTHSEDGYVLAVTPVTLEGVTRTKRSISVRVLQNYTGGFEPVVRVRHDFDAATPEVGEVSTTDPVKASPFGRERWRPMGYLTLEEEALAAAIREKIGAMGL